MNPDNITVSEIEELYLKLFDANDEKNRIRTQKEFNNLREMYTDNNVKFKILTRLINKISRSL